MAPSGQPTSHPSMQPSGQPSNEPTGQPSSQPSGQPTEQPTSRPSGQPTGKPSRQPSGQPSSAPTINAPDDIWFMDSVPLNNDVPLNKSAPNWQSPCNPSHWTFIPSLCNFRASVDFCTNEVPWEAAKDCQITLSSTSNVTLTSGPISIPQSTPAKYSDAILTETKIVVKGNGAIFNAGNTGNRYMMTYDSTPSSSRRLHTEKDSNIRNVLFHRDVRFATEEDSLMRRMKLSQKWNQELALTGYSRDSRLLAAQNNNELKLQNITLSGFGSTTSDGGALYINGFSSIEMSYVSFLGNKGLTGGAIYIINATYVTITGCTFKNNIAINGGGAVFLKNVKEVIVEDSTFESNIVSTVGGAIATENCKSIKFRRNIFTNNTAAYHGGAISINKALTDVLLKESKFIGNIAEYGSSICLRQAKNISGIDNIFTSNSNLYGATVFWIAYSASGLLSMIKPIIWSNNIFTNNLENGFIDSKGISSEIIGTKTSPSYLRLIDYTYGGTPFDLRIDLVDSYNSIITREPQSTIELFVDQLDANCMYNTNNALVYGTLSGVTSQAVVNISSFGALCTPGVSLSYSILIVSYLMWSGALYSSDVLLSYSIISLA